MAEMIEQMVSLTAESTEHAKTSSTDLESLVETTHAMTDLASDMGQILENFREEFERVKAETMAKLKKITEQTTLLALNCFYRSSKSR